MSTDSRPSFTRSQPGDHPSEDRLLKARDYHIRQIERLTGDEIPDASLEWAEGMVAYHRRGIAKIDRQLKERR